MSGDTDKLARDRAQMIHALTADELDVDTFSEVVARWDALVEIASSAQRVMAVGDYRVSPTTAALRAALSALDGDT